MELTDFERSLIDAWRAYESECDPLQQAERLEKFMGAVTQGIHVDGFDSVFYARRVDRVNNMAYYANCRDADDVTFLGLAALINRDAESTNPPAVLLERD